MLDYKVSITIFIRKPLRPLDHYPSASVLSVPDVLLVSILPQQPPFFHQASKNFKVSTSLLPKSAGAFFVERP